MNEFHPFLEEQWRPNLQEQRLLQVRSKKRAAVQEDFDSDSVGYAVGEKVKFLSCEAN